MPTKTPATRPKLQVKWGRNVVCTICALLFGAMFGLQGPLWFNVIAYYLAYALFDVLVWLFKLVYWRIKSKFKTNSAK